MSTQDRNDKNGAPPALSRRSFLSKGAAAGVGAAALTGAATTEVKAEIKWDHTADMVIIGAGVSGLAAAITARDHGVSVIAVEENYDIGGQGVEGGEGGAFWQVAALDHAGQEGVQAMDDPAEVDAEHPLPLGARELPCPAVELDAGVVAEDVDGAEPLE